MATQPPEPPENWRPMQHPQQWGPPPPPQPPKLPIYRQWWFVLGAIVAASLVIGAITNSGEQSATTTTTRATVQHQSQTTSRPEPTKPQADASAQLACDHFRNVADDISSGVLTPEQVTTKLQEVYGTASRSDLSSIGRASQDLLAAWNRADVDGIAAATRRLSAACASVGH